MTHESYIYYLREGQNEKKKESKGFENEDEKASSTQKVSRLKIEKTAGKIKNTAL